ncbi:hypothetical protein MNBD_GAMMA22-3132 [hydrothermal vent metagenome]|uniref:Metallophosphoesterase n=1 Tax=hydrothermal vent metagenome TaxID=652676 RepID=A0A3B1B4X8_9ZZZZ
MKSDKKQTIKLWLQRFVILLLGLVLIYGVGRFIDVSLGSFYSGERAPYLQMLGANQVTIQWQSKAAGNGVVWYGIDYQHLGNSVTELESNTIHKVQLSNLEPATRYYYSVGTRDKIFKGGTQNYWFETAPKTAVANNVRFWVLGDPGDWNKGIIKVRDSMSKWLNKNKRSKLPDLDFIITTGDNAYTSGSNKQFQKAVFEPFEKSLQNYSFWPAYGNHDARRWAFFEIFSFPTKAELGGVASNSEHYFSFDYGQVHMVFLDVIETSLDKNGKMLNWLRADLLKTKQKWLITVFHYPPYTKGSHDSDDSGDSSGRLITVRENIVPVLEKYGVDLVLTGHSHMYERSGLINCHYGDSSSLQANMVLDKNLGGYKKPYIKTAKNSSGTVYVVLGSSSKVDKGPLNHPANIVNMAQLGSMIIDVNETRLDAKFINDKAQVVDNFSIVKDITFKRNLTFPCVK